MSICGLAKRISYLKKKADYDPMSYIRLTPPQKQFVEDKSRVKILLGGNQVGKTLSLCYLILSHVLPGRHPTLDEHVKECWLICYSHEQSRTIQEKLYSLIPKHTLKDDCVFISGKGFKGLVPVVRFKEEYGGSIVRIKTAQMGTGLESGTVGLVAIDEPVSAEVYNACIARTFRGGRNGKRGIVAISMTPVGSVDCTYIKDLIDKGDISCTKAPLTLRATTPIGLDPLLSQEQIDSITSQYLEYDKQARIYGSFQVAPIGVIFSNFKESMITNQPVPKHAEYKFCIGIDHGSTINSQVVTLACVATFEGDKANPRVYMLDEYVSGQAPPETHVVAILDMLKRNGVRPSECKWTGDGVHHARRSRDGFRMSNILLMRAFERQLGYGHRQLPFTIRTPLKRRHSVYYSTSLIHSLMSRQHFFISPKCKKLIESIKYWTLKTGSAKSTDPYGHAIDSMRYCICGTIDSRFDRPSKLQVIR